MASAKPARKCPPNGRYPFNITASVAGQTAVKNEGLPNQKGGDTCIKLDLEIAEGEYAGYPAYDTLGTDGGTDFGSMSKKKWRALEVPYIDSDQEVPDDVIAQSLLNRRIFAEVERKPIQKLNTATNKWEDEYELDEQTGVKVPRYKLQIVGYLKQPTATQTLQAPVPQQHLAVPGAPQFQGAPIAGAPAGLPPGYPTQLPAGAPGAFPGAPQFAGQPGAFPGAPGAYPGAPGGFPQVAAPQGWVQQPQNGVPGGAPGAVPGQTAFPGMPGAPIAGR